MWKLKIGTGGPWLKTRYNFIGRQVWEFDEELGTDEEREAVEKAREEFRKNRFQKSQNSDLLMRMQFEKEKHFKVKLPQVKVKNNEEVREEVVTTTLRRVIDYVSTIQAHDGHWPGDSPGPLFLTPFLVISLYVTNTLNSVLSLEHKKEIRRYLYNTQNKDGGWGFNLQEHSSMLATGLSYIALRLLGEEANGGEDDSMETGRNWILEHGGIAMIPTWGKVFVSVLGVMEWSGVNPIPPEHVLIPSILPFHPGKLLRYFRLTYLPMAYLYGKRFVCPTTDTVLSLRKELHTHPYNKIDWSKARKLCAQEDLYYPHNWVQELMFDGLYNVGEPLLTRWPLSKLREKALRFVMEWIHYEDENSVYLNLGLTEKVLFFLACWVEDPNSDACKYHLARIPDYLWVAEDGMKMRSCSSQSWDAALVIQAILSSNLVGEYGTTLTKAHEFMKQSQILENPSGNFNGWYRSISKGGWAFQEADRGWSVSDCTAEAIKATLLLSKVPSDIVGERIATDRVFDAVHNLLSLQTKNGGFTAWELPRSYPWVEKVVNASEIFADTAIEYPYVECTSSAIQALLLFMEMYPKHWTKEIAVCVHKAINFIESIQEDDGSWYGNWGNCYTYGTWFAIEGLVAGGKTYSTSPSIRKACMFLLSKQLECGGWGESSMSSKNKSYTNLEENRPNLVNTAWAMLALLRAEQAERDAASLHCAARLLINMQLENGEFPQQEMVGTFMKSGLLNYPVYRNVFPMWALGEYRKQVLLRSNSF